MRACGECGEKADVRAVQQGEQSRRPRWPLEVVRVGNRLSRAAGAAAAPFVVEESTWSVAVEEPVHAKKARQPSCSGHGSAHVVAFRTQRSGHSVSKVVRRAAHPSCGEVGAPDGAQGQPRVRQMGWEDRGA